MHALWRSRGVVVLVRNLMLRRTHSYTVSVIKRNQFCTNEFQDPAHGAVPSTSQHSEIWNISEEIQSVTNTVSNCILIYKHIFKKERTFL